MAKRATGTMMAALTAGLTAAALTASAASAQAAPPEFKRGVSMELWTSWPAEAEWADEAKLFPFPEWRRLVTDDDLAALKSAGLDFVRLPVDPGVFASKVTAKLQGRLLDEVAAAAQSIRKAGLNVIIDLHTIPGGSARPATIEAVTESDATFDRHIALAETFAKRFAPMNGVALELINEPVMDCEPGENRWPAMMERLHAAARKAAPQLPLVVTGACWGEAGKLEALPRSLSDDALTLFSFHSYAPFVLTHQGATWAGDFIPHVTGLPFPPNRYGAGDLKVAVRTVKEKMDRDAEPGRREGLKSYLDEQIAQIDTPEKLQAVMAAPFEVAARFADDRGIDRSRILLGEFGMIRQEWGNPFMMPDEWRVDYLRVKSSLAEKNGFGWAIWGYSGAFGVVQGFGGEVLPDSVISRVLDGR
jgi:endoglucanase